MAVYKVAQDVEAEDKLLGPFGFRQFIYLIIVGMSGILGYGLWQLFPPLAILPLPLIIFFGALALPLRKDQPMETYLAAIVSYYLKPRQRLWQPDGVESIVEITVPKNTDENRTKDFSGVEADKRLSYLADLADTRGWAIRHSAAPVAQTSMVSDIYNEAVAAPDVLDDDGGIAQSFESLIDKADAARREQAVKQMHEPKPPAPAPPAQAAQPATAAPAVSVPTPVASDDPANTPDDTAVSSIRFDPYPSSIHQAVIQPLGARSRPRATAERSSPTVQSVAVTPPPDKSTSVTTVSPDIMNLANNTSLSVETIAHEARRIKQKDDDEVVISLR